MTLVLNFRTILGVACIGKLFNSLINSLILASNKGSYRDIFFVRTGDWTHQTLFLGHAHTDKRLKSKVRRFDIRFASTSL